MSRFLVTMTMYKSDNTIPCFEYVIEADNKKQALVYAECERMNDKLPKPKKITVKEIK